MSHNWTVSGQRTTTGKAVLHSDPQISVTSPPLWYEVHLSGKTYRVRGLGVAGPKDSHLDFRSVFGSRSEVAFRGHARRQVHWHRPFQRHSL